MIKSGRTEADSPDFDDRQASAQRSPPVSITDEGFQDFHDLCRTCIVRKAKHDNPRIFAWWIVSYIGEIEITRNKDLLITLRLRRNDIVRRVTQSDVPDIRHIMSVLTKHFRRRARQTRVHEEAHGAGSARQRVVLFLFHQFAGKFQRRADVFNGQVILPLHILEAHSGRQAAHDDSNRGPGAANNRLAVANIGIDENSIMHRTATNRRCPHLAQALEVGWSHMAVDSTSASHRAIPAAARQATDIAVISSAKAPRPITAPIASLLTVLLATAARMA